MPKLTTKPPTKPKSSTTKYSVKVGIIPKTLLSIEFNDLSAWLKAHKSHKTKHVIQAAMKAFRHYHLYSQAKAAKEIGLAENTFGNWENGKREIRWASKLELVKGGWFAPEHFGVDGKGNDSFQEVEA